MKMTHMIAISLFAMQMPLNGNWLERKAEGWAWYEQEEKSAIKTTEVMTLTAEEQLEAAKKQLNNLLAEALLDPSDENLTAFMKAQQEWIGKSAEFAIHWKKMLLSNPELDFTAASFATTQYGRQLQKKMEQEQRSVHLRKLAREYGLYFFYEGSSMASQAFAQVVKAFADKHQWEVVGIAVDGVTIPAIPSTVDQEIAEKLGVAIFPSLFAFKPQTKEAVPLAFGLRAIDQIENNVCQQLPE